MEALWDAARRFAVLTLLCGVLDVLLPEGGLRGYARFAMGLLIAIAMIAPLATLARAPETLAREAALSVERGTRAVLAGEDAAPRVTETQVERALNAAGISGGRAAVRYGSGGGIEAVRLYGEGSVQDKERAALGVAVMLGLSKEAVTFE